MPANGVKSKLEFLPQVISWNLTYNCNLKCSHCYLDAACGPGSGELTTEEGLYLIDEIAHISPGAMLVLSGGEPLLRQDIFQLASHASTRGLMVVMGTNGTLLDVSTARKLAECGLRGIGISLDSPTPDFHDRFRGMPGAWQQALDGIAACKKAGLAFQVQTTVVQGNYAQIAQMIDFAYSLGATVFDLFFLVCAGRGQNLTDLQPQQYETLLTLLRDSQPKYIPMLLRPRCAPYHVRLLNQSDGQKSFGYAAGCLAGLFYCRITPEGALTPCPYLALNLGNVLDTGFTNLWQSSPQLQEMRASGLGGKCGICEFSSLCRGCRARAYSFNGSLLGEDPWCLYQPEGSRGKRQESRVVSGESGVINQQSGLESQDTGVGKQEAAFHRFTEGSVSSVQLDSAAPAWSQDALARLDKVPPFLRPLVKKAAEAHARRKGITTITAAFLSELKPHKVA